MGHARHALSTRGHVQHGVLAETMALVTKSFDDWVKPSREFFHCDVWLEPIPCLRGAGSIRLNLSDLVTYTPAGQLVVGDRMGSV